MNRAFALLLLLATPLAQAALCEPVAHDLTFGAYSTGRSTPTDAVTTITLSCTADLGPETVNYSVAVSPGMAGFYAPRRLAGAEGGLEYNLYADSARSVVLGDGTQGTVTLSSQLSLPGLGSRDLVVFGRIPAHQAVAPGHYGDLLSISVEF